MLVKSCPTNMNSILIDFLFCYSYPHMSNGSVPNGIAGRQGYDNPGMVYVNTVDGNLPMYGLNEKQESMPNGCKY